MTFTTRALAALASGVVAFGSGLSPLASPLTAQARTPQPSKDSAIIVYDDDGLRIHSADGKKQFKIRAYFVGEYHVSLGDSSDAVTNALSIKRSRLIFDGNLNPWLAARVMYDVGPPSGTSPLQDAYIDFGPPGGWWIRAGKQKTPVGLERYMSISSQLLPDRSIASNAFNGSRDAGILFTSAVGEHLEYSLGVFAGVPDGNGTQDSDPNDAKDFTYRLWWKPVRKVTNKVEQGFGLAYNGSTGIEKSPAAAGARLPVFKTISGSTYFSYLESQGVRASGRHSRNGVFSYFHRGAFGAFAEVYQNSQVVSRGTIVETIPYAGWVANAQFNLTGELSAQEGVTPATSFDPAKGNWGAWQIGARAAMVSVDEKVYPTFASRATAARQAIELGAALNWYITRQTKFQLAYEHQTFDGGAAIGDRKAEQYVMVRWQAYF
jgi:phosphate-selective porin OprO/OprP